MLSIPAGLDNEERQIWHLRMASAAKALRELGPIEGMEEVIRLSIICSLNTVAEKYLERVSHRHTPSK